MLVRNWILFLKLLIVCACVLTLSSSTAFAQDDDDDGVNNTGGITISTEGILNRRAIPNNARQLNVERFNAAKVALNQDLQKVSELRKVSINRLEAEVAKMIDAGTPISPDALYLAGLTRITHVFFYPETKDIVIAGPAEGFFFSAENFVVGMDSGRATLKLEDLVVALRAFAPDKNKPSLITCSIDPTQEGLVKFRNVVKQWQQAALAGQLRSGMENQIVKSYKDSLGLQTVTINGVSPNTDFARVLVEADYRMKLIGMDLEQPAVKGITSFVAKANPSGASNALQRWFFEPDYDCVTINDDKTAIELRGQGVKLVGEDETVGANGQRKGKGKSSRASRAFTTSFTKTYAKLADKTPIWAELRNVIDMSVAAAFIQKVDLYNKADWSLGAFGDETRFPVEKYAAATQVAPIANAYWKNGKFMSPIAGGVQVQARVALNSDHVTLDTEGKINKVRDSILLDGLKPGQWWWD
ncbi:DUF1598 domain-containing protein [Mariniblastus sp.]|nr:DUF1598 domain-containing protein [Mariniblastus sp.]